MVQQKNSLHGYYFEELEVGMSDYFEKTVTDGDISMFAEFSCDTNPLHLNQEFSETSIFNGRIAHGMLSASFISTVIGTKLPGPGSIYMSQTLSFKAPVRPGDTVVAQCSITRLVPTKFIAEIKTQCRVGANVVIDGEAVIKVPSQVTK